LGSNWSFIFFDFLHSLKRDVLALERLYGICLELVIFFEPCIETDHSGRVHGGKGLDEFHCQGFFQTDQEAAFGNTENCLSFNGQGFDGGGQGISTLEDDLIKNF